jgi:hypothetical protein
MFCQGQSQCYVMTDGQLANLFWCQAPTWDLRLDFYYCQTVAGLLVWSDLSDKKAGLSFKIAAGPCEQQSFSGRVARVLMQIFSCLTFETPRETGWPSYTRRHWVSFSTPPTTRRAAIQLFEPAEPVSTRSTPYTRG